MNFDDSDISEKSSSLTLFLCIIFGSFGAHRFYVGKYFTGLIYLLIGGTSIIYDFMGFGYGFIAKIVFFILMVIDIYALYSDSFTDSKGKLITDHTKNLVYDTLQEREQIIFNSKLNKILCIVGGIVFYVVYFVIVNYVVK